jgi:hypothetical protein
MSFSRRLLCGTYDGKRSDIPGLTEAQAEALDAVDALARKHELRTTMCHGDIRIINNMALLHRKEPYEDSKTTERHLIRVWAHSNSHCWKLPESLQVEWASVFDDYEKPEKWPFMIRRIFKLGRYEAEGLGH